MSDTHPEPGPPYCARTLATTIVSAADYQSEEGGVPAAGRGFLAWVNTPLYATCRNPPEDSTAGADIVAMGALHIASLISIYIKLVKKHDNMVNFKRDKNLKVAIVGNDTFAALQVNADTVTFCPSGARPVHSNVQDNNRDGFSDLIQTFKLNETGIACVDEAATLNGQTFGDPVTNITGSDSLGA